VSNEGIAGATESELLAGSCHIAGACTSAGGSAGCSRAGCLSGCCCCGCPGQALTRYLELRIEPRTSAHKATYLYYWLEYTHVASETRVVSLL